MVSGEASRNAAKARRSGKTFWRNKLTANQTRDRLVNRTLRRAGWTVIRIWEHDLRYGGKRSVVEAIRQKLKSDLTQRRKAAKLR